MPAYVEQLSVSSGGIPKLAILSGVVGTLGIAGDVQRNLKYHGGPRQALLWVTAEGCEELAAQGFAVCPGALGENLTTRGVDRCALRVGQRWRIGDEVEIEITKLREPCATLNPLGAGIQKAVFDEAVKAGDISSPLWGLAGFYAAVIRTGTVTSGDIVALVSDAA
jgi:MOSC domain-containing protein YiiM